MYLPGEKIHQKVTKQYHESPTLGHPGRKKTLMLMVKTYWWPGITKFVNRFIEGCATCQQNKPINNPSHEPLHPLEASANKRPFVGISMDLITDLPESDGFDAVLVVVDQGLSKGVIFIPCNKTVDALGIAKLLRTNIFKR